MEENKFKKFVKNNFIYFIYKKCVLIAVIKYHF